MIAAHTVSSMNWKKEDNRAAYERDRMLRREFNNADIEWFIRDFATCGAFPGKWLAEQGISGEWDMYNDDVAEVLQGLAIASVAGHHLAKGEDKFWQTMKRMAGEQFDNVRRDI